MSIGRFGFQCIIVSALLSACATVEPPELAPVVYRAENGNVTCTAPWSDPKLSIEDRQDVGYDSVSFLIEKGSAHILDRFQRDEHKLAQLPTNVDIWQQLEFAAQVYSAQLLVPNFDLVEVVAEEKFTIDNTPALLSIINIQQGYQSQHHGFLFFLTPKYLNVIQYTHPLAREPGLIRSALENFYRKCSYADVVPTPAPTASGVPVQSVNPVPDAPAPAPEPVATTASPPGGPAPSTPDSTPMPAAAGSDAGAKTDLPAPAQ